MTAEPTLVVAADDTALAAVVAARLIERITAAQTARGTASVVLAGGGVAIAALGAVAASPDRDRIDWTQVELWWGDERFVPAGDPDRNEGQAGAVLLDQLPLDPAKVHPMGASDGPDSSVEDAAARYAGLLAAAAPPGAVVPLFDVLLLGMGPEGHTASIFPGSPAARDDRPVFAVRDCPKPPPTRISLGFSALSSAREVWLVASGAAKAEALALAYAGARPIELPAAGPRGREATVWLLDDAAAQLLRRDDAGG